MTWTPELKPTRPLRWDTSPVLELEAPRSRIPEGTYRARAITLERLGLYMRTTLEVGCDVLNGEGTVFARVPLFLGIRRRRISPNSKLGGILAKLSRVPDRDAEAAPGQIARLRGKLLLVEIRDKRQGDPPIYSVISKVLQILPDHSLISESTLSEVLESSERTKAYPEGRGQGQGQGHGRGEGLAEFAQHEQILRR